MAEKVQMNNYRIPGMRGPRNRQQAEKPKDGKKTLRRLVHYFQEKSGSCAAFWLP